jgi:starvation-inducible DNA-binding protein
MKNGLNAHQIKISTDHLSTVLANEFVLYTKARNYHWNVTSNNFMEFHKLFEDQYTQIALIKDDVAERIRALGEKAIGSMQEFIAFSKLEEDLSHKRTDKEMVENLIKDHEAIIIALRPMIEEIEQNEDISTVDFLTGLMESHEKMAWMLRSYTF